MQPQADFRGIPTLREREGDPRPDAMERLLRGKHLRAGRVLLDWSRDQISAASGLSLSTIRRAEDDSATVSGKVLRVVVATLRRHGIVFSVTDDGILAVGRRPDADGET